MDMMVCDVSRECKGQMLECAQLVGVCERYGPKPRNAKPQAHTSHTYTKVHSFVAQVRTKHMLVRTGGVRLQIQSQILNVLSPGWSSSAEELLSTPPVDTSSCRQTQVPYMSCN